MLQYPLSAPYLVVQKTNWKINFLRTYQIVESVERRSASTSTAVCTHSIYQDSKFYIENHIQQVSSLLLFKGRIKPKAVLARRRFSQKTNKQICFVCREKQKQNKFIRSFFGRIYGAPICFRFYLTFSFGTFNSFLSTLGRSRVSGECCSA